MKTAKKSKSSYTVIEKGDRKLIKCQGRKSRSSIYFADNSLDSNRTIFLKQKASIFDEFELVDVEGEFQSPTREELGDHLGFLKNTCLVENNRGSLLAQKKIKKVRYYAKQKNLFTYGKLRLHAEKYKWSKKEISEHFGMSRVTVRKILKEYDVPNVNKDELDSKVINRSKGKKKYSDENKIVEYINSLFEYPDTLKDMTIKKMAKLLTNHFGLEYAFKQTKTEELMKKAGFRYKRVKVELVKNNEINGLSAEQKVHLPKLVHALATNLLLIFVDETYVTKQLVPKRIWVHKLQQSIIPITPKDQRATVVAACSLYSMEAFQVIYEPIDATHYCIFLLSLYSHLQRKYPDKQPIFIHDNARPHIGKICGTIFQKFPFIRQSPYSPKMNMIEYVFGFFKKHYRQENYQADKGLKQEILVRRAFEHITTGMFRVAKLEMFDYLLESLIKENLIN